MVQMKFTGVPEVRHGFCIDLRETIEDVHLNVYAKLGIFYVGQNLVIKLSDYDKIRDWEKFSNWLYVILDHVVMKVYVGSYSDERNMFRA